MLSRREKDIADLKEELENYKQKYDSTNDNLKTENLTIHDEKKLQGTEKINEYIAKLKEFLGKINKEKIDIDPKNERKAYKDIGDLASQVNAILNKEIKKQNEIEKQISLSETAKTDQNKKAISMIDIVQDYLSYIQKKAEPFKESKGTNKKIFSWINKSRNNEKLKKYTDEFKKALVIHASLTRFATSKTPEEFAINLLNFKNNFQEWCENMGKRIKPGTKKGDFVDQMQLHIENLSKANLDKMNKVLNSEDFANLKNRRENREKRSHRK